MKPRALMTAYCEGSLISRELHDMLAHEAEAARFERELRLMQEHDGDDPTDYGELMHEQLVTGGAL